jgi:phosphoglycerate dehydrogenase-like enzyme
MRVMTVGRSDGDVDLLLSESDYVIASLPLTPSTRGLIDRRRLALMKESAVFINIGRGATVDEEALVDALKLGRIKGAALDVFETEPLPPDSPLWRLENVLISPHTADHTEDSHLRAMRFFVENLARYRAGARLENIVDKEAEY